ncbi:MAG TPA: hypothetical protein VF070_33225 [Streptosporangiaceae bacterium]
MAFIVIAALAPVMIGTTSTERPTAFGDFSTLAGYSFTLLYLLVSLAAIGWVVRQAVRSIGLVAAGLALRAGQRSTAPGADLIPADE